MDAAIWVAIIGVLSSILAFFYKKLSEERRINIGVFAEIHRLIKVLDEHAAWWKRHVESNDTGFPLIPFFTPVFDHHERNLGRLEADTVGSVVQFYGYVKFINALQDKRPTYIADNKSAAFDAQYLGALDRVVNDFRNRFDAVFQQHGLK